MRLIRFILQVAFGLFLSTWTLSTCAQSQPREYDVKAAYLFNFAKYLEWPADAFASRQAPLILCIAGRDPFDGALAVYERRVVQSRDFHVRRSVSLENLQGCHMLFLEESLELHVQQYLRAAARLPIITVSDIPGFTNSGGAIGIVSTDDRIQFEINLPSAQRSGVKINPQLLRVARNTREKIP